MTPDPIRITPKEALEKGFTHFLVEDAEYIRPIEDLFKVLEDAEGLLPLCWLVEPEPELPLFDADSVYEQLLDAHIELPEGAYDKLSNYLSGFSDHINALVDQINAGIFEKKIGAVYYPTNYILCLPVPTPPL